MKTPLFHRLAVLLLIALLHVAAHAVQPALRDYNARLDGMKRQIPAIVKSAEHAAENMLEHPDALITAPSYEQRGFAEELKNRSGGLARVMNLGEVESTKHDIVLLSVRSWETQAAYIRRRVKAYHKSGWTVTVIGSKAGRPRDLGADFFIDNGAPSGKAEHGRINAIANVTLGWMWCCEYAAAMSRQGKFPAILLSAFMPGSAEYDASIQTPEGRATVVDCPVAIPPGELSNLYLTRVRALLKDLQSDRAQGQLGQAAGVIAGRLAKGGTVGISGFNHFGQDEMSVQSKTPWINFRSGSMVGQALRTHLKPGDLLVWFAYAGMNTPYADYEKYIAEAKVDLITCYAPDPVLAKDPPPALAHIDQSWALPDAEVPIPVFPAKMAPVSDINAVLLMRMLDDEVSARLKKMRVALPPPVRPPVSPELCDNFDWEFMFNDWTTGAVRKWGLVDKTGKEVTPIQYDYIGSPSEGLIPFSNQEKSGFLDETGKVVIPATFDGTGTFENGVALVIVDDKPAWIDKTGKLLAPPRFDNIKWPRMNMYPPFFFAHAEKGWGVIDHAGKELLPCQYEDLQGFTEKVIVLKRGGKYGLLAINGEELLPPQYDSIGQYNGKYALVKLNGMWGAIDGDGKEIVPPQYAAIGSISDDTITVRIGDKWGCVTRAGAEVIPAKYDGMRAFRDGVAQVLLGFKWGLVDTAGKEVAPPRFDGMRSQPSEGLTTVDIGGKWGSINNKGEFVIPLQFDAPLYYTDGVAATALDGKWRLIDKTGADVLAPDCDYLTDTGQDLFKIVRDGKWGLIDKTGKEILPPKYSFIMGFMWGDTSLVAAGGAWTDQYGNAILVGAKWGLIDSKGNEIIAPKYDRINPWGGDYYQVATTVEQALPQP